MTLLLRCISLAGLLSIANASAQAPAAPVGTRATDLPLYLDSARASLRALTICSGLWSGKQTMKQMEQHILNPPGELKTEVDSGRRTVAVTYSPSMPPRIAVWRKVLGCAQLPVGATMEAANYLPQVPASLEPPDFDDQPWPMGDQGATAELPKAQHQALDKLLTNAFDGTTYGGTTWGIIVVKDGKIVAERYALGFDMHIGHQTHSAAKSFAATLAGIATRKNALDLQRAGALLEWRRPGDPRGRITAEHLLHMTSGLYGEGGGSPQSDIYFQGGTVAELAATNLLLTLPGTRFLYNPPDTMLLVRAIRQAVNDDQQFMTYPYQEMYWKIGMTRTVTTTDWNGDFLMSGQTYSTARDFARFGLLYLADGVWNGTRILPQGWASYVATPGPVQPADSGPGYGAQFWLYGGQAGLPKDAFSPRGAEGQFVMIVPSRNTLIVRRGIDLGSSFRMDRFAADVLATLTSH